MGDENTEPNAVTYRSGVAARLAGVPVETLRVWERRYAVVGPRLSPRGQRLYSTAEIRRLTLIKQLVDVGHPIGAIAALPIELLVKIRTEVGIPAASAITNTNIPRESRIALVGAVLAGRQFEQHLVNPSLRIVGRSLNISDAPAALHDTRADTAIIELSTLNDTSLEAIGRVTKACGAKHAIIFYRFAPSAVIRQLRRAGHEVARAPSDAVEFAALCCALLPLPSSRAREVARSSSSVKIPAPRFDERGLFEIASASTAVYCECPRHLVDLVLSLGTFERYSAECANRGPVDSALHRDLEHTAGVARAMLEDALIRVASAEGIPLPFSVVAGA